MSTYRYGEPPGVYRMQIKDDFANPCTTKETKIRP